MSSDPHRVQTDSHNWVWVPDKKTVFKKGYVLEIVDDDKVKVRFEDGSDEVVLSTLVGEVNPAKFDKADDIAELTFLNEASVLHNLDVRYKDDSIYTYSGLFLVAINPYNKLPIYSDDYVNMYHNVPKADTKPHIFAETEEAYQDMLTEKRDQSILVTGESGAGKTENTKKIIQYLAAITSKHVGNVQTFEQQIIQANPILEAFGNSQTVRNNNSSRFGKFIKIEFDSQGKIAGAHIDWYLLEKSRVVKQSSKERNYHIFYQLLAGLTDKELKLLGLEKSPSNYAYLKDSNFTIPGVDDKKEFNLLKAALDIMGIPKTDYYEIFKLIAAILFIGNIEFASMKSEQASFKTSVDKLSELLGVTSKEFSDAILRPKVKAGREVVKQSRNAIQAKFSLDALSKSLYEKIFKFLVDAINNNLDHSSVGQHFIGVLDIAGFEIFKENSFEQLCINYTNEKLQQFFNHHMFVLEQNEYLKEDIEWKFIDFGQDLQQTIDLIEKQKPIGIFSVLEEECIVPKSSDSSFFEKLNQCCNNKSEKFKPSKFANKFTLKHYAGDVEYSTIGWIEKNRDPLSDSIIETLASSKNKFVSNLYSEDSGSRGSSFKTVSQRHKEQLNGLLTLLSETHPHFVRCIIPNHKKKPQQFDKQLVIEQLKCNGVLEGIRIVRSGFPNRIFFKEFYDRYKVLASNESFSTNMKSNCQLILTSIKLNSLIYKVGATKIFFKAGVLAELEVKRDHQIKTALTNFKAIARGVLKRRFINRKLQKVQASQVLMNAFKAYNKLSEDPWFSLYASLKPLLESSQQVMKTKHIAEQIKTLEKKLQDLETEKGEISNKKSNAETELAKIDVLLQAEKSLVKKREDDLQESKKREKALESKLEKASVSLKDLESQKETAVEDKAGLENKLKEFEADLEKGSQLVVVLEKEKLTLQKKIKELESTLKKTEDSQKINEKDTQKIQEELKMLKTLVRSKDKQIKELQDKVASHDEEIGEKIKTLNLNYAKASSRVKELIDENKILNSKLKTLQESNSQIDTVVAKKESDLELLKNHLRKQAEEIRLLVKERDSLKLEQRGVSAELNTAKNEVGSLKTKYAQLEHEAKEARELLQKKISEDVKFNRGKQQYDHDIASLKVQIKELTSDVNEERAKSHKLSLQIRDLTQENDVFNKERKVSGINSASGQLRTRSLNSDPESVSSKFKDNKELIKEYSSIKLIMNEQAALIKKEGFEKTKLKADLKLLHNRLASETFDKQQLKIKLTKLKESLDNGETPVFSDDALQSLTESNSKLQNEVNSLKVDLALERKASQRAQGLSEELQRRALKDRNSMDPPNTKDSSYNQYKAKYEESQAKIRLLERSLSNIQKSPDSPVFTNGLLTQKTAPAPPAHDEQLLQVYQDTSRKLNSVSQDLAESKDEITVLRNEILENQKTIASYKTKDVETLSNQLAREELAKIQLKLQAVESKNVGLSKSVKLYKLRAEEYFNKLEDAETAIRNAKYSEKFSKEQLTNVTDSAEQLKKELKGSENTIVKLHSTVSQLKEHLEAKDAELSKAESSNLLLKEEIHHYHQRLLDVTDKEKSKVNSQISQLNNDLTLSLRTETDLRKNIGALELELDNMRSQKDQEIRDLTKEKSYYLKMVNDLKDENSQISISQKDLEIKLRSLMKQLGTLNESVDALIRERDSLSNDKKRLETQVKDLTSEYHKFENERETLAERENSLNLTIEKHETEIDDLLKQKKQLKSQCDNLSLTISEEKQKVVILTEENQSLGKFTETLQSRISELEDKLNVDHDAVWVERLSKTEKKLEQENNLRVESDKVNKGLERSVDELKDFVDRQQREITKFDDERAKYDLKITELYNAIHKWQSADSTSRLTIKRAEREIRHLQENSMELEKELEEWKGKFDAISNKRKSMVNDEIFI